MLIVILGLAVAGVVLSYKCPPTYSSRVFRDVTCAFDWLCLVHLAIEYVRVMHIGAIGYHILIWRARTY